MMCELYYWPAIQGRGDSSSAKAPISSNFSAVDTRSHPVSCGNPRGPYLPAPS